MDKIVINEATSRMAPDGLKFQTVEEFLDEIDLINSKYIVRSYIIASKLKLNVSGRNQFTYGPHSPVSPVSPLSANQYSFSEVSRCPSVNSFQTLASDIKMIDAQAVSPPKNPIIYEMTPLTPVHKVQFKRAYKYYTATQAKANHQFPDKKFALYDFVVVECGDRGEDLGVIVQTITYEAYVEIRRQELIFETEEEKVVDLGYILRHATRVDKAKLPIKHQDEQSILEFANTLLKTSYPLPIKLIGSELQFDRAKLYIYYTASNRVDFRDLVKTIFGRCKVRVWMIKVNRNDVFVPDKYAELGLIHGKHA